MFKGSLSFGDAGDATCDRAMQDQRLVFDTLNLLP